MTPDTFLVSRAGYKFLLWAIALFLVFSLFGWGFFRFLTFIALVLLVAIYRNPEREIPYFQKGSLLSPVDGKIVAINSDAEGYEIVIKSSLFDTAILRSPLFSTIKSFSVRKGARLSTDIRKSMLLNEKVTVEFEDENNHRVVVEHIVDNSIDDITLSLHADIPVAQGKRYGVMTRGLTKMKLPNSCRISLHVGDRLKAGETLLGYIA